jgi:hypothetical protein
VVHAGQAYALAPGASETRLPLSSVKADFAPLECPDAAVIAAAEALEAPPQQPIAPRHGGPESASAGGRGGILGTAAGLGLVAALTGGEGGAVPLEAGVETTAGSKPAVVLNVPRRTGLSEARRGRSWAPRFADP